MVQSTPRHLDNIGTSVQFACEMTNIKVHFATVFTDMHSLRNESALHTSVLAFRALSSNSKSANRVA